MQHFSSYPVPAGLTWVHLFGKVQIVTEPLSSLHLLNREAGVAVGEGQEKVPTASNNDGDDTRGDPNAKEALASEALLGGEGLSARLVSAGGGASGKDELNQRTGDKSRGEMGREVVVQEELTTHEEEGEVVGSPSQPEETGRVVQLGASAWDLR